MKVIEISELNIGYLVTVVTVNEQRHVTTKEMFAFVSDLEVINCVKKALQKK